MKITWSGFMFGDPVHISYLDNFSNFLILLEMSFMLTFPMAYLAFLYLFLTLLWSWEPERLPTPFLISPILPLTPKMSFLSCSDLQTSLRYSNLIIIQGDTLVTTLDLLVFPNFATTIIFHVHRLKQIFLTCEVFLLERLPSGATMINRRRCYNY